MAKRGGALSLLPFTPTNPIQMKNFPRLSIVGVALMLCALFAVLSHSPVEGLLMFGLGTGFLMADAKLSVTRLLPAAASATVNSLGIDLETGTRSDFVAATEVLVSAPALSTTIAPDTRTMTYRIQHDTDSAFGTAATLVDNLIVQTGAGGVGAAAATARFKLPTNVKRYIRLQIVSGASTTDASALSATMQLLA
jgi:hypothetical protein